MNTNAGKLYIIGLGPGGASEITPRAKAALEDSQVVAGYTLYIDLIRGLLDGQELLSTGMTGEVERCRMAVQAALEGKTVSVVSSGDSGVYGMAGLVCQLAEPWPKLEIEVIPGITAACAAGAALGAPITHDFAAVSLSDLLTPWETIEKRLCMAAEGDFVLCLYNPASKKRTGHLRRACEILLRYKPEATPCGIARNVGRRDSETRITTLGQLADEPVDMLTTVIVGNSDTKVINGRLVTPRGYTLPAGDA